MAAALPQLRRHRTCSRTAPCSGVALGNGWYRGRLTWSGQRALYGDRLGADRAARDHLRRRPPAGRRHRRHLDRRAVGRRGQRPLRRPDDRRPPARRHLDPSRCRRRPGGAASRCSTSTPACSRRTSVRRWCGTRRCGPTEIWTSPSGRTLVDFGQNLVGWLRLRVRGEAGPAGHRPARRGARERRARRPPAAHRRGHRPLRAQRRRRRLRAHVDLPRLPLRRGRRAGRASSPPTTSRPSSCTPTCAAPATSSAPTRC